MSLFDERSEQNGINLPPGEDHKNEATGCAIGAGKVSSGNDGEEPAQLNLNDAYKRQGLSAGTGIKQPPGRLKKMLLLAGLTLTALLFIGSIYLITLYNQIQEPQRVVLEEGPGATVSAQNGIDQVFPEHIVNIGFLGFDRGWDREARGHYMFRPDAQLLISIDFDRDQVSVIRLLRDSYVPIHGARGFYDKINHAYQYGYYSGDSEDRHADGIRYTLLTMSNVLGDIPIHYYIAVDMYAVIALIDALGGVYYDVEEEIVDKVWIYGVLLPPIPAGPQLLDGTNYMRYLQYRDAETDQDYGRNERQIKLLMATYHYLRQNNRITDLPVIYRIYKNYVDTDLSYKQIAALANYALKADLTADQLQFYTLTGEGQMKDGIYYEIIKQEKRLDIVAKVFGIAIEPWPPIVLQDSPEYIEEQERLRKLEEGEVFSPPHFPDFEDMKQFEEWFYQQ